MRCPEPADVAVRRGNGEAERNAQCRAATGRPRADAAETEARPADPQDAGGGSKRPGGQVVSAQPPAGGTLRWAAARVGYSGVLLALTYPCLLLAAVLPAPVVFLAVALVSYAADWSLYHAGRARLFSVYRFSMAQRFVLREALAVVLLLRMQPDAVAPAAWLVAAIVALQLLRAAYTGLCRYGGYWRGCRFAWRNVVPDGLPEVWPRVEAPGLRLFGDSAARTLSHADVPLVLGTALVGSGLPVDAVPALVIAAVLLAMVFPAVAAVQLRALRTLPGEPEVFDRLRAAVERLAPTVVVYFSGPRDSTYQLNVWLPTLNRSRQPTLVILREGHHLAELAETALPVVVLPRAEDVAGMHLSSLRGAIFSANAARNNDMLRLGGIRSTFIIHGDSDKASSFNPYTRVYDEIWVAGEAGRARYARTREGIRPEQVELVGRPQLAEIEQQRPHAATTGGGLTVLYAPTWEGLVEGSNYCSLLTMGEELVRRLTAVEPRVRLLFKGHPGSGMRDRAYRAAAERIKRQVTEAGEESRVVEDIEGLYAAFNQADILVTDISSVATDFLYSGKPLIVTNPQGQDDAAFVAEFPSTEAAYRIGPDYAELGEALRLAVGADPLRDTRRRMRSYLLGEADGDPVERFLDAIDRLVERNDHPPPRHGQLGYGSCSPARGK